MLIKIGNLIAFSASVLLRCTSQPHTHGSLVSTPLMINGSASSSDQLEQLSRWSPHRHARVSAALRLALSSAQLVTLAP